MTHTTSAVAWVNKGRDLQWETKLESKRWQLEQELIQMEMNQAWLMELQHKYMRLASPKGNYSKRENKTKFLSGGKDRNILRT